MKTTIFNPLDFKALVGNKNKDEVVRLSKKIFMAGDTDSDGFMSRSEYGEIFNSLLLF